MNTPFKVVVIGGGPSGLTAAIYASRAQLGPLMIEGIQPGGQLTTTTEVENYPGFPDGVDGNELMQNMRRQAEKFGTEFLSESVISVDFSCYPYLIETGSKKVSALSVIVSTGAQPKLLGLESEKRLTGHGVSVCATCDGFFFRGKKVAVVGGGDAAMEEAIFLTRFAESVMVIHRRDQFKASPIMVQRARDNGKIEFVMETEVEEILSADGKVVTGVRLKNLVTEATREVDLDGIFVAIGHSPNTTLFQNKLKLDALGYIETDSTRTSVPGVFACGDVQDAKYRQAITAAGTGCEAALEAQWYLESVESLHAGILDEPLVTEVAASSKAKPGKKKKS